MLQDELDRRRSRLTERRFKRLGLDERLTLADFDWRFNPKLPRAACFELHTLKFIADGANALIIGKPGTGKSHVAKAVAYQATLQGYDVRYVEADTEFARYALATPPNRARRAAAQAASSPICSSSTTCSSPGASPRTAPRCCRPSCTSATSCAAPSSSPPTAWSRTGANTSATPPWPPPSWTGSCTAARCCEFEGKSYRLKEAAARIAVSPPTSHNPLVLPGGV